MTAHINVLGAVNLDEKMRLVKAVCDNAPLSDKKVVSLRRYMSAERARTLGNEIECVRRLDAAIKALR